MSVFVCAEVQILVASLQSRYRRGILRGSAPWDTEMWSTLSTSVIKPNSEMGSQTKTSQAFDISTGLFSSLHP